MQAVPYLAFKSLSHFLVLSLFLLQQSVRLGRCAVVSSNPRCWSVLLRNILAYAECALYFFSLQEGVIRKKVFQRTSDYLELWLMCVWVCVCWLAPRSSKIFLCRVLWRDLI